MSTGRRGRMATMYIQMRRQKDHKPMMDERRMWRTERIIGFTSEPVMWMGLRANIMMRLMRRRKHCKQMMNWCTMWRTEGIVLESLMIGQHISDL
jgi:hypothetical protein